jgi:hypothetical protein
LNKFGEAGVAVVLLTVVITMLYLAVIIVAVKIIHKSIAPAKATSSPMLVVLEILPLCFPLKLGISIVIGFIVIDMVSSF